MNKKESKQEIDERANSIALAIKVLNQKIAEIEEEGEVALPNCHVARYQAQGSKYRYYYYQLKAEKAIFPKAIDGLKESWSDLYSDEKKVGNRVN